MDLLDFSECKRSFEDPLPAEAEGLTQAAAQDYGTLEGERALLYAHLMAPAHLTVLLRLGRIDEARTRLLEVVDSFSTGEPEDALAA